LKFADSVKSYYFAASTQATVIMAGYSTIYSIFQRYAAQSGATDAWTMRDVDVLIEYHYYTWLNATINKPSASGLQHFILLKHSYHEIEKRDLKINFEIVVGTEPKGGLMRMPLRQFFSKVEGVLRMETFKDADTWLNWWPDRFNSHREFRAYYTGKILDLRKGTIDGVM
jgi:hypothetical protein